jgi:hypothetical protein
MKAPIIPHLGGTQEANNFRRLEESIELNLESENVYSGNSGGLTRVRSESRLGDIPESEDEEDAPVTVEEDPFEQFSSLTLIH